MPSFRQMQQALTQANKDTARLTSELIEARSYGAGATAAYNGLLAWVTERHGAGASPQPFDLKAWDAHLTAQLEAHGFAVHQSPAAELTAAATPCILSQADQGET